MITVHLNEVREWRVGDKLKISAIRQVSPGRWEWELKYIKKEGK